MSIAAKPITADELFAQGSALGRCELVAGEIRPMTPAGFEHGNATWKITRLVGNFVDDRGLGMMCGAETGFIVANNPDTVLAPDGAFVSHERLAQCGVTKKFYPIAPDLAIEVLSPGDRVGEVDEKVQLWLAAGCRAVWVISPSSLSVVVHHPGERPQLFLTADVLEDAQVLPGLKIPVHELFDPAFRGH